MQVYIGTAAPFEGISYAVGVQSVDDRIGARMLAASFAKAVKDLFVTVDGGLMLDFVSDNGLESVAAINDSRASITTAEFTVLYGRFGTIEKIVRYLKSIKFQGILNVPAGTYNLQTGGRLNGFDGRGIYIKCAGVANTNINIPESVYGSWLEIGLCRIVGVNKWINSDLICADGETPAACTFEINQYFWNTRAMLDGSLFEKGIDITYGSRVHADGARFYISQMNFSGVPVGINLDQGSYLSWQGTAGRVSNPGNIPDSYGAICSGGSYLLGDGMAKIGQAGQTITYGVQVLGDGTYKGPATFQGTVTTQYNQAVNVRTNEGLIIA